MNYKKIYGTDKRIEVKWKGEILIIPWNESNMEDEDYILDCIKYHIYEKKKEYIGITGNWKGR